MEWFQGLIVTGFVLIHLFAHRLRFLDVIPRSRWLSMAGGISVAYVFLHLFPELAATRRELAHGWLRHPTYVIALLGLVVFYGLERRVKGSRRQPAAPNGAEETPTGRGVFWLHIGAFALYNGLIGYLLVHREDQTLRGLLLFSSAMGLHFLVNDYGLRQDHRKTYQRIGRWVLASAVILGWGTGLTIPIHQAAIGVLFAFLAGGVVLNVLKEELPEERASRFAPFALGAGAYAALLLLL